MTVGNREVEVREEAALSRRSARSCISARTSTSAQPRVLLVAPLSGHFATLLRDTVRTLLPTTTSTSPTGTTRATCRSRTARSASTTTSST